MKPLRMVAALLLLLLTAWGIFLFSGLDRKTVYATPDNQSAFLKSYTPEPVVDSLRSKRAGSGWANDHQREFHGEFEVQGQDLTALATALSDDVIEQLARCGIRVIGHGGSPQLGFRYSYQAGQTLGEVVIAPVRTRNARSFTGGTPVAIDVYLDEKWFPAKKGQEARTPRGNRLQPTASREPLPRFAEPSGSPPTRHDARPMPTGPLFLWRQ